MDHHKTRGFTLSHPSQPRVFWPNTATFAAMTGESFWLRLLGYYSAHSNSVRVARQLYDGISRQAASPAVLESCGVAGPATAEQFPAWWAFQTLHVWMVLRRVRSIDADKKIAQCLFETMFADVEMKLRGLGLSQFALGRFTKQYQDAFYGSALSYDMGTCANSGKEGDAQLSAALWRNLHFHKSSGEWNCRLLLTSMFPPASAFGILSLLCLLDAAVTWSSTCFRQAGGARLE